MQNIQDKIKEVSNRIIFNKESHTYMVDDKKLTSCTTYLKKYSQEFNAHMISAVKAKKTGINADYYKQRWEALRDESAALGTRVHLYAQYGLNEEPIDGYERSIMEFFVNEIQDDSIVGKEVMCYHKGIAGCIDLITLNDDGTISIYDYKTSSNLDKSYGKMKGIFSYMADSSMNKYKIQLNIYKWMLENEVGLTVRDMYVVHITKDGYKIIEVANLNEINNN